MKKLKYFLLPAIFIILLVITSPYSNSKSCITASDCRWCDTANNFCSGYYCSAAGQCEGGSCVCTARQCGKECCSAFDCSTSCGGCSGNYTRKYIDIVATPCMGGVCGCSLQCSRSCGTSQCNQGETRNVPCGNCGTQAQVCSSRCAWVNSGSCINQGPCAAGSTCCNPTTCQYTPYGQLGANCTSPLVCNGAGSCVCNDTANPVPAISITGSRDANGNYLNEAAIAASCTDDCMCDSTKICYRPYTPEGGAYTCEGVSSKTLGPGAWVISVNATDKTGRSAATTAIIIEVVNTTSAATCEPGNLALNKPTNASSTFSVTYSSSNAVDGYSDSAHELWASALTRNPEWIEVNLGAPTKINLIKASVFADRQTGYAEYLRHAYIQYWNGTSWIDLFGDVILPYSSVSSMELRIFVPTQEVVTDKLRVYSTLNQGTENSNVFVREIQAYCETTPPPTVSIDSSAAPGMAASTTFSINCVDVESGCNQATYRFATLGVTPTTNCANIPYSSYNQSSLTASSNVSVCAKASNNMGMTTYSAPYNWYPSTCYPELCDNLDNDCDSQIDENWPEKGQTCYSSGKGECRNRGVYVCKADKTGIECSAHEGNATTEICNNGEDDDCDEKTDCEDSNCASYPGCCAGTDTDAGVGDNYSTSSSDFGKRCCGISKTNICKSKVDCMPNNPKIPGNVEIECNLWDDDCNASTPNDPRNICPNIQRNCYELGGKEYNISLFSCTPPQSIILAKTSDPTFGCCTGTLASAEFDVYWSRQTSGYYKLAEAGEGEHIICAARGTTEQVKFVVNKPGKTETSLQFMPVINGIASYPVTADVVGEYTCNGTTSGGRSDTAKIKVTEAGTNKDALPFFSIVQFIAALIAAIAYSYRVKNK